MSSAHSGCVAQFVAEPEGVHSDLALYNDHSHVYEQYQQRNTSSEQYWEALTKAGRVGENDDVVSRGLSYEADELWLFAPPDGKNLLFIVHGNTIKTVLRAKSYRLDLSGVRRCSQCGAIGRIVLNTGCSHCSDAVQQLQRVNNHE